MRLLKRCGAARAWVSGPGADEVVCFREWLHTCDDNEGADLSLARTQWGDMAEGKGAETWEE
jgi:hypothetical protein